MGRKILIVDDNYITVEGLRLSVNWQALGIDLPLTAYDGQTALELIQKELPDLVISDISMPGLSGLELAEQVQLIHPSTKIILISAYDSFEYAKKAVQLGAYDYVEKPLNYDALTATIQKALREIEEEKKQLRLLRESRQALEEQFFRSLLTTDSKSARDLLSLYIDYLHFPAEYQSCLILQITIEDNNLLRKNLGIEEYHLRLLSLEQTLKTTFSSFLFSCVLRDPNGFFCILGSEEANAVRFKDRIIDSCQSIRQLYLDRIPLIFGVGSIEKEVWTLSVSLEKAQAATMSRFFFPEQTILEAMESPVSMQTSILNKEANEEHLISLICQNDRAGISDWIREFTQIFPAGGQYRSLVYTLLYSILSRILKFCYEMNIPSQSIEQELARILSDPSHFHTIDQVSLWLNQICGQVCDRLQSSVTSYHQTLCDLAMTYIEQHYTESDLSLNQIAENVRITPAYLSSLFKKYRQQNISTVITNLRIDKACQLLKNTTLPLKEISDRVGYSNQFYFSSCFKKRTGLTPSVYRES